MASKEDDSSDSDIFEQRTSTGSFECRDVALQSSQELTPVASQDGTSSQGEMALSDSGNQTGTSSYENVITGGEFQNAYLGPVNKEDRRRTSIHIHVNPKDKPSTSASQPIQEEEKSGEFNLKNGIRVFTTEEIYRSNTGILIYKGEKPKVGGVHQIAVKFCSHNPRAMREAQSLEAIRHHPNVVGIYDTGIHTNDLGEHIFIAMELCSKENLFDYVNQTQSDNFDPQQAIDHSLQVIRGLQYIHSKDIFHRDLKPHNILFVAGPGHEQVKITDFGVSKSSINDPQPTSQGVGTMGYTAPEVLDGRPPEDQTKCDIFSLGILVYFRLSHGKHPYGDGNLAQLINICNGKNPNLGSILLPNRNQSRAVQRIIGEMLRNDPNLRPTTTEILRMWMESVGDLARPESPGSSGFDEPVYEIIENPCIIGASSDDELVYWRSILELKYDPRDVVGMPEGSGHFTLIGVGRRLYMLKEKTICHELDLDNVTIGWKKLPSMKHDHGSSPPAAVLHGKLYVCGKLSWSIEASTNKCEVFTGHWSEIAEMNEERNKHCVVSEGGCLYSIGGLDGQHRAMSSVEKYIPKSNAGTWVTIKSLNVARYRSQVVVYKEKIYVVGGYSSTGEWIPSFEFFDPVTSCWTLTNSDWLDRNKPPNFLFVFEDKVLGMPWTGPTEFRTVYQVPLDNEDEENLVRVKLPGKLKLNRILKLE